MAQHPRAAPAADVAAIEDEVATWADLLDVDDSDLRFNPPSPRLPRPCTTAAPHPSKPPPPSSHYQRIPGPVSAIQDAMRLRDAAATPVLGRAASAQAADSYFLRPPWLGALQFLGKDRAWENPGIRRIKRDRDLHRAPLVLGVVTSCKPNGLGDLFPTLKDPCDTIGATIHKKVILEGNIGQDISVGCVLLLIKVLRKDCGAPSKKGSSNTTESQLPGRVAHLDDNHVERRAEIEISEGAASIFSKMISRTEDSQVAKVRSENSDTSNVVHSSTLRLDRGTIRVENKTNLNHPSKNVGVPSYSSSQQWLKTFSSINRTNCHQGRGGSSPTDGSGAEGSTNNIMMRLLARERMMPSSKDMTVAEGSRGFHGRRYSNNSTSTLDTYARCSLGSNQEILMGGPPSEHPLNSITGGRPQQNLIIPNTTCFQPSIGGRSVMSGDSYCTQESANEQMLHSSKKLKSDGVFSDSNGAIANTSMDTMNTHCLGNNMDIEMELDVRAKQSNGEHPSIRKPSEHKQMDDEGSVEQTKEGVTTISKSFLPNTKKAVSVASVAGWTEEQLAELFTDY